MSLESSTLRKRSWFHLPAFAVIAASASFVFVADKGIDAYSARFKPQKIQAQAEPVPPPPEPMFSVAGIAEHAKLAPERITWNVSLTVHGKTEADAERALAARREQVAKSLLDSGVALADLDMPPMSTEETFKSVTKRDRDGSEYDEEVSTGYDAMQDFFVSSTDIAGVLAAHKVVMINPALDVEVMSPECTTSDKPTLRASVERAAVADARDKAEHTADELGGKPGKLVSISTPQASYVPYGLRACTEGLTLQASVSATFQLR